MAGNSTSIARSLFGTQFSRFPRPLAIPLTRAKRRYRKRRLFERAKGGRLDKDAPAGFTEKLVIRILEDYPIPYFELTENKITAPWYALSKTDRHLRVPECYGYWRSPTPDDLANLPTGFVLKSTHGSGAVRIIRDRYRDDVGAAVRELRSFNQDLRGPDGRRPNAFIMAEELLLGVDGRIPSDLKFHCFNRRDGSFDWRLQIISDRFQDPKHDIFDSNLTRTEWNFKCDRTSKGSVQLPADIDRFIAVAQDLSSDFDYIRIDLFDLDGEVVFGEFTPTAADGNNWISPRVFESIVGRLWDWDPYGHVKADAIAEGVHGGIRDAR